MKSNKLNILHVDHLAAEESHEISCLFFDKNKDVTKLTSAVLIEPWVFNKKVCCRFDWLFKG